MHGQQTISRFSTRFTRVCRLRVRELVIIAAALPGVAAGADASLTTTTNPASHATAAATLTTVIIDGSTVYSQPQLFAAYRDHLGQPDSRGKIRALGSALAELYVQDG
jgi:hypothetical protein